MQDFIGSVRRSFNFRSNPGGNDAEGGGNIGVGGSRIAEKIGSCLRKSRVGLGLGLGFPPKLTPPSQPSLLPELAKDESPPIRWRKGELIGCGAFGHVYMGMNLDSGELLAVKQVLIGTSNASKEKAQAHIRELEEEVNLLKNLSHPNIVRYLGTVREEETLNILLEFVPGGSISSLLGKFGSFPEAVIKMYTKQLLQGLEYLHRNGIIHRDIKGANILVDNKGCIKLADFGASKQVAKLATMTAAKSMKGTPYWMAPEVILQTGHSFSADIWSVGCTVIEMATGKPPWSQQYQEVAALFHIGTTKSHPPIPDHLSQEANDFLLKCLQKEPNLRTTALDLLQHSFVTNDFQDSMLIHLSSAMHSPKSLVPTPPRSCMKELSNCKNFKDVDQNSEGYSEQLCDLRPIWDTGDDMCRISDNDEFPVVGSSFNPMSEPFDEWPSSTFSENPTKVRTNLWNLAESANDKSECTFPCEPAYEEDDEVTESKIRAFLDEKALDLKKLQTPLYEEFFNSLSAIPEVFDGDPSHEYVSGKAKVTQKNSKPSSPCKVASDLHAVGTENRGAATPRAPNAGTESNQILREIPSAQLNELGGLLQDSQGEANIPSLNFSERQRRWKEELDQELERERELRGVGKVSPLHRCASRKRDRFLFMSPGK
ncbi:Mitogen-activated protein kinase kinase kinase NPK1 [Apostasia shenzhenica]|uniref:mitogen-activated protein kinase kinase kinase n=1 Tax=Apostasia shenzhenica TaxID=1088818 RepID=A0A2H9ZZQ3_9ASPA|nr:Mitogen-activated protein kinase kinase kinase NPK1 [Apostasia shenzhenica]